MRLKNITLKNIRSYKDQIEIEIPDGRTLIQGDIGCGKTTILLAIEFALFGLGEIDGNYLLRTGQNKGFVILKFQVNDRTYEVYRSLIRKGKSVVQDQGYIVDDDIITNYAVSEMKAKILEIININEKIQTNSTSVIYRFAIFIPQEMMKQILGEKVDKRLEILRRAFGIEDYNIAKKSTTSIIIPWVKEKVSYYKGITKDFNKKESSLNEVKKKQEFLSNEINEIDDEITRQDSEYEKLQKKQNELKDKKDLVIQLQATIPYIKSNIAKNKVNNEGLEYKIEEFREELNTIQKSEQALETLKPIYEDYITKKNDILKLRQSVEEYENFNREKVKIEQSIDYEKQRLDLEINRLKSEINREKDEIEKEKEFLLELESLEKEESNIKESVKILPDLRRAIMDLASCTSKENAVVESKQQDIRKRQAEIEHISSIGNGAQCPKCKQNLTISHILKVKEEFSLEKKDIEEEIINLKQKITQNYSRKVNLDLKILNLEEKDLRLKQIQMSIAKLQEKKESIRLFSNKIEQKEKRRSETSALLNQGNYLIDEKRRLNDIITIINKLSRDKKIYENLENQVDKYEEEKISIKYSENLQIAKRRPSIEKETKDIQSHIQIIIKEIDHDTGLLQEKQVLFDNNKEVLNQIQKLEEQDKTLQHNRSENKQLLASKQTELKGTKSTLYELEAEVIRLKENFTDMQVYQQTLNWIEEVFVPTVDDIEKHVLQYINEDFNHLFQTWFNMLVETEDISVEVDDSFTPLITQNGYLLDVHSLSGGEKTSVALAYRLALNKILKQSTSMENSLLILDEPTDGFSKEQLIRLREVLDEMKIAQIILISHERELESFVDKIYRIIKEGSISRLEMV